jgi:GNAT superfamily N-acetyltransferase
MSVERMTKLVARAMGLSAQQLLANFIPGRAEHLTGVVALRRTLFGAGISWDDAAYLRWRYRFGSTTQGRGDCWVLLLDGTVAGMVGAEEIELRRGEEKVAAWSTMDIAVDPRYEGSGLGSWMNLRLCEAAGCAITIGSNEKSRAMITRTFQRLPNRRTYVMPLRFQRVFYKRLGALWLAKAIAPIAEGLARVWRWVVFLGAPGSIELKPIQRFGADSADLLRRSIDPLERQVGRSVDYLNWRLFGNPRARYSVIGAYEGGVLLGYMATALRGSPGAPATLVMADWTAERQRFNEVFRALCANAARTAVADGAESVSVTAYHARSEKVLRRLGFLPRFGSYETIAVYSVDSGILRQLTAPQPWFITEANTDRDTL